MFSKTMRQNVLNYGVNMEYHDIDVQCDNDNDNMEYF